MEFLNDVIQQLEQDFDGTGFYFEVQRDIKEDNNYNKIKVEKIIVKNSIFGSVRGIPYTKVSEHYDDFYFKIKRDLIELVLPYMIKQQLHKKTNWATDTTFRLLGTEESKLVIEALFHNDDTDMTMELKKSIYNFVKKDLTEEQMKSHLYIYTNATDEMRYFVVVDKTQLIRILDEKEFTFIMSLKSY